MIHGLAALELLCVGLSGNEILARFASSLKRHRVLLPFLFPPKLGYLASPKKNPWITTRYRRGQAQHL